MHLSAALTASLYSPVLKSLQADDLHAGSLTTPPSACTPPRNLGVGHESSRARIHIRGERSRELGVIKAAPYECPTKITGQSCAALTLFVTATSSASEIGGF